MPARPLPANPSWEQLRKQAKEVRDLVRTGRLDAVTMALPHPRWAGVSLTSPEWARFTLADAQLVVARSYGFASWRRFRQHVDMVARYSRSPQRCPADHADPVHEFLRLACLTNRDSWNAGAGEEPDDPHRQDEARRLLAAHPGLAAATIHTAAAVGDVATARALLAADASLANRQGGPHRWPPLLYVAFSRLDSTEPGHSTPEVARLLLAHGADPDAGYLPDGQPPPVTALSGAFRGHRDPVHQPAHQHGLALARLLLDAGADPNDEQALRNACAHPHDDDAGLELLLEHGLGRRTGGPWRARLDRRQSDQLSSPAGLVQTELRYSAQWNLPHRTRLLVRRCAEAGIDIDAAGTGWGRDPGQPARQLAAIRGNTEIVDLLGRAGARATPLNPVQRLVAAAMRVDRPAVRRLLAGDPGLAERAHTNTWLREPVHQAVALNRPEAVALLVSLGFPLDEDNFGWGTPLHTAALAGHLDIVRLLVGLGADPTAEAPAEVVPHDRTPAGWARYHRHDDVVAYLTSSTVDPPPGG